MTDSGNHDQAPPAAAPPEAGFGGLAQAIGTRNLWIIILTMPAVFLVAVAAIIAVFGRPGADSEAIRDAAAQTPPAAETAAVAAPAPLPEAISVPAGAAPGAIALDGDRLAVRLDGPDGVEVVVYDLAKGEVVARVPFKADD